MGVLISDLHAREVIDSRGNPTLEVELTLSDGSLGRALVPSGASKGQHEALELRDGDPKRFGGRGTLRSARLVQEEVKSLILKRTPKNLEELDKLLIESDGTPQKSKLGGNTILGVSLAYAQALAGSQKRPLYELCREFMGLKSNQMRMPVPLMNVLNGGVHANNGLEFQEFMIVPHGFPSFTESLRAGCEVFQGLKRILHDRKLSTAVGDEGGFAPELASNREALELISESIEKAGYKLGSQISLALDVAASSFYDEKTSRYEVRVGGKSSVEAETLMGLYGEFLEHFPIVSIEDGLYEDDWAGWGSLTKKFGNRTQLVGDDLFVTQVARVRRGMAEGVANAVLIKVNQVGSLTETFETMRLCRERNYTAVVSHRSGETEDVTIAHLAVGSGCGQIKTGSLSRGERTAKYNELLRIEERAAKSGHPIPFEDVFKKS